MGIVRQRSRTLLHDFTDARQILLSDLAEHVIDCADGAGVLELRLVGLVRHESAVLQIAADDLLA